MEVYFKANLDAAYGLMKTTSSGTMRKTDDRWVITSSYNRQASKSLYYTLAGQIKSQFSPGRSYTKEGSSTIISDFLSPEMLSLVWVLPISPARFFQRIYPL